MESIKMWWIVVALTAIGMVVCSSQPASADDLLGVADYNKSSFEEHTNEASQLSLSPRKSLYRNQIFRQDFAAFGRDDEFGEFPDDKPAERDYGAPKLSIIKAVALSTLIPGAGQWYVGKRSEARLFFGAEAGIWASFAALKVYANWKQDDVERFATRHAGVNGLNREEQFFRQLTFYSSRDEYNSLGRAFDPSLPFIPDSPENDWNWDSQASRSVFRQLFNDQNSADRNSDFMFIAALVNRLTSAVLAWRSVKKYNNRLGEDSEGFGSLNSRGSKSSSRSHTLIRLVQPASGRNASDGLLLAISHSF